MRILLSLAIILVIMAVLGVPMNVIIGIILAGIGLVLAVMCLFFIVSGCRLIGAKRCTARFSKIDSHRKGGFLCPYYITDSGEELPNAFPAEMVLQERIYVPDKEVTVLLTRNGKSVFDRNAFWSQVIGLAFTVITITLAIIAALMIKNGQLPF